MVAISLTVEEELLKGMPLWDDLLLIRSPVWELHERLWYINFCTIKIDWAIKRLKGCQVMYVWPRGKLSFGCCWIFFWLLLWILVSWLVPSVFFPFTSIMALSIYLVRVWSHHHLQRQFFSKHTVHLHCAFISSCILKLIINMNSPNPIADIGGSRKSPK